MSALLCLQGGGEFQRPCLDMDAAVLDMVGSGTVAVAALAASRGSDYARANANGVRWWAGLGATAVAVPDARDDQRQALAVLASASLVVLPGGSPSRLRRALVGTRVGALLADRWHSGECALVGASAGAMVLCSHMVLPEDRDTPVVTGLSLLPRSLALPHWSGSSGWLDAVSAQALEGTRLLGLPECSGIVVEGDRWMALGATASELVPGDGLPLGEWRQHP